MNTALNAAHCFGDPAPIRRDMVGLGLLSRNAQGTGYRRREAPPPPEARALIRHIASRRKAETA